LKEPKPTPPEKLIAHFAAIEKAAPAIDIVLQDHPASTQVCCAQSRPFVRPSDLRILG
jgi:dihydrodipicolinate synthase/N-acetylneuraminate lyase